MDRPIGARAQERYRKYPFLQSAARLWIYWTRELLVPGFVRWPALMRIPQFQARRHLARQVADPALRARLTPGYSIGCKRIILSDDWYPALQRPNVEVVSDSIVEVRRTRSSRPTARSAKSTPSSSGPGSR
jgi:cation diffusion facilitator CzcD-associated flavoprotein CzcO